MSHSQFHCIKSFILRHAWLNLWDKHMTTGRINQVTLLSAPTHLRWNGAHTNGGVRPPGVWSSTMESKRISFLGESDGITTFSPETTTLWFSRQVSLRHSSNKATARFTFVALRAMRNSGLPKSVIWCKQYPPNQAQQLRSDPANTDLRRGEILYSYPEGTCTDSSPSLVDGIIYER